VVDATGNVYVTDAGNYCIRKITPAGVVTTVAGSVQGYADGTGPVARFDRLTGPAIDATGNIYVGDIGNNRIRKISPGGVVSSVAGGAPLGYADGPIATALFRNPCAVAVDPAGNLYVSDGDNNVIRKIGY
jgi:DNA-binding beta-propeller fold protein YncE